MSDTMKTELKPCPFCGGAATYGFSFNAEWVECSECEVEVARDTFAEAAEAWNRRAALDSQAAQEQPSGWTSVKDQLPPIDGETVFIGINTAGFACCFNNIESTSVIACFYDTAENSECLMSSLLWWRVLDRPASPSHSKEPGDGDGPLRNSETGEADQHQGNGETK